MHCQTIKTLMIDILLLMGLILFSSCQKKEESSKNLSPLNYSKETIIYKKISGVSPNLLSLDIYYDSASLNSKPVIIWVHGGAWCLGDKANQMEHKKDLFAKLGYILVSINYRLSPFPYEPNNPNRIKFPVHNMDIADAIKWVDEHISNYGGDSKQIALLGHSAGAHLVSLMGTNQNFLQQAGVPIEHIKGIAAIDTKMYDVYHEIQEQTNVDSMYLNAFGTDLQENIEASPIRQLHASSYPRFFIAKRGSNSRIEAANQFMDSLLTKNITLSSIEANMYTHAEINEAIGAPGENIITPALIRFFKACFEE